MGVGASLAFFVIEFAADKSPLLDAWNALHTFERQDGGAGRSARFTLSNIALSFAEDSAALLFFYAHSVVLIMVLLRLWVRSTRALFHQAARSLEN